MESAITSWDGSFHQLQLASKMKEALRNEKFYKGDNPLDNDDDDNDREQTDDDDYSSEEDEEDTKWGKGGVGSL